MLRRKIYDSILEWKKAKNGTCLLIKGARQIGKTHIIRKFEEDNIRVDENGVNIIPYSPPDS